MDDADSRVQTRPTFDARPVDMVDDTASRTYQKYGKVDLASSTTAGKEGNYLDSGLMLGRSFRVGWSQDGRVINLGTLYNSAKPAKFDVVKLDKFKLTPTATPTSTDLLLRTLSLQLSHTTIYPSTTTSSVPVASPSASLRFHHFVAPLSPLDRTTEAHLFRLGHALFDEIKDLAIPEGASYILRDRIVELRRRERLEKWLEDVVRGEVEEDLRAAAASGGKGFAAKRIFALLSGHQVERACDSAIEGKDLRLATLVAQAGGDAAFREDVFQQLARWRKYGSNEFISKEYRRVYELLCGNVGSTEAEKDAVAFHVAEGLDWKRAFGLHLWYGTLNRSVGSAVAQYESAANVDPLVASPLPSYLEKPEATPPSSSVWKAGSDTPSDPLFQLLKIFTSPTHALESVLLPRNFGTSPLDYRLPWHLYILLSRVLRRRDFGDRVELGEDGEGRGEEGNSVRADAVTEGYAMQLEAEGRWDWAIFVLLHLELEEK
jgi:nuclear pore complex protein Nup98-Nup96